MKNFIKNDLIMWIVILAPVVYLAVLWKELPDSVPVHWNLQGEVNRYGSKTEILIITFLPFILYLLFFAFPKIDPKNKLKNMGSKYSGLRTIVIVFLAAISMMVIYTAKHEVFPGQNMMFILMGGLFTFLGNYMKTIKANYFIGIKTPWTLENETVWKDTHAMGGKLWFAGGIVIIITGIFANPKLNGIIFGIVLAIIVIIPTVYSYLRFQKLKKE